MSEEQSLYVINPHYQTWAVEFDIEDDEAVYKPCTDHAHKWHLNVIVTPDGQGNFENEVEAWCQCGASLSQAEIQAVLNRTVQA